MISTSPAHLRIIGFLILLAFSCLPGGDAASTRPVRSVPICSGVSLSANYLALAGPDQGPGFRFVLVNRTGREIRLAEPVPSSSHWYARPRAAGCGGHRMERVEACWTRATSMAGWWCMLPRQAPRPSSSLCLRTSPGNGSKASRRTLCSSTSLAVRCALIPGSASTRWSLPMRILPAGSQPAGLLSCGLRSAPVPMPPKILSLVTKGVGFLSNQAPECGFLPVK